MWNIFFCILIGVGFVFLILIMLLVIGFIELYFFDKPNPNDYEPFCQIGGGRHGYTYISEGYIHFSGGGKLKIITEPQEEDITELASSEKELEYLKIKKELKELKKEIRKINIMSYPSKTEKFGSCVPENLQKAMIESDKRYEKKYWEEQQRLQVLKKRQRKLYFKKIKQSVIVFFEKNLKKFVFS